MGPGSGAAQKRKKGKTVLPHPLIFDHQRRHRHWDRAPGPGLDGELAFTGDQLDAVLP